MRPKVLLLTQYWHGSLGDTWGRYFKRLGYEVSFFDEFGTFHNRPNAFKNHPLRRVGDLVFLLRVNLLCLKIVGEVLPDLILVSSGRYILPATLRLIKEKYAPILFCWNPDSPFNPVNSSVFLRRSICIYDVHFTWSKSLIEPLKRSGAKRVEYLPFAYDPELHPFVEPTAQDLEKYGSYVVFVGTWDRTREQILEHLIDFDLAIWGNGWENLSRFSPLRSYVRGTARYGVELVKIYRSSKIVLNILRDQNAGSHNMRTFEATGCGAFLITSYTEEQAEWFSEGEEIEFYRDVYELREKVLYYLSKPDKAQRIAQKARAKVLKQHTYLERIRVIDSVFRVYQLGKVEKL